jgi:iron complex transport system substrate-binding protein
VKRIATATLLVLAVLVAGCTDSDDDNLTTDDKQSQTGSFPVTIAAANGSVTVSKRPTRIVSLSPTATEMVFAVGAGKQVVAVDDQSNYPADAPHTDLSGFEPNVEAIAGRRPDLVLVANDTGSVVAGLQALDIPVLLLPAAVKLDDTYTQLEQVGAATGHVGDAAEVVAQMQDDIEEIAKDVKGAATGLTYYHELDDTLFTVTSKTFIGAVYGLVGLENVADAADKDGSGYPQLSAEYLVQQDPDLIFLADTKCCGQSAETLAQRPGFADLKALGDGGVGVVELDDDIASRWGPRVVDFLRLVAQAVERVEAKA